MLDRRARCSKQTQGSASEHATAVGMQVRSLFLNGVHIPHFSPNSHDKRKICPSSREILVGMILEGRPPLLGLARSAKGAQPGRDSPPDRGEL